MTESETPGNEESGKYASGVNKNARLVVRNLPWQATEDSIRKHFEQHGQVEEVKLLRRPDGKLVGCGFVHFKQVPMANKALVATNKKHFLGRPLHVGWAIPKNKYEENLNQSGKSEKFNKNLKRKVSESDNQETQVIEDDIKTDSKQTKAEKVRLNRNARLIVRNVSFKATEESLRQHFEPYGDIHEVKLLKKPDGKLVGCAFVHFKNVPMAKKALLNTNMKPYLGRPVSVDWAVAKDKYMQHMDSQRLEMQEHVKSEDSDSEQENTNTDVQLELKPQVKSESEDSDDNTKFDASDQEEEESDEDDDDDISENHSKISDAPEKKRVKLNDAEDGKTVFVTNLAFSVDSDKLREFAEKTAPVQYALVCVDGLTEHSRGTGFIKFQNEEDASRFLSLPPTELTLDGQAMQPRPALTRDHVAKDSKKQQKDNRNLYLVKEGVVVAGTKAAVGVSASDMAKRLALERSKTQMLKNLNRFVSRYRLVVSNLPASCDDARLRRLCVQAAGRSAVVTEARVMRDLRAPVQHDGKHPSKGFGFVMFTKTEDALTCLRKLNNNPDIFDKNNRPIVSFSIEDRTALNARKKRLEKSIANNPLNKKEDDAPTFKNKKNPKQQKKSTEEPGRFVKRPQVTEEIDEFAGLTSRQGSQHYMRSGQKLKAQSDVHRQNVKLEKKKSKRALKLKMAAKERIKQPKMKINKNPPAKKSKNVKHKTVKPTKATSNFSDLVSKYKSKLVGGNKLDKVKSKWYE